MTRSGDQAWDFAVPLTLLKILPGQIQIAALYYLLVRLAHVLILPRAAKLIDRHSRPKVIKIGILAQTAGVLLGAIALTGISSAGPHQDLSGGMTLASLIALAVMGGLLSSLGSSFMDVAVANDLVPSTLKPSQLSSFNSRLRQLDLLTEVTSPVLAGAFLLIGTTAIPLLGFYLIVAWNLISFIPEMALLTSVFRERPDLRGEKVAVKDATRTNLLHKLTLGWSAFFRQPVAMVVFAYALLWLSVLSPHGVLLTAFLKDGWNLPEWQIGLFRGGGALFGLIATLAYPSLMKKLGLVKASGFFLASQAFFVCLAVASFFVQSTWAPIAFLVFILLSRVGLYGFSLGEVEIRQRAIAPDVRGEVNGFASALTGIATLALYAGGAALPSTQDFWILATASVTFIILALLVYLAWAGRPRFRENNRNRI